MLLCTLVWFLWLPAQGVPSADRIYHRGCGFCRFGTVYCCFGQVGGERSGKTRWKLSFSCVLCLFLSVGSCGSRVMEEQYAFSRFDCYLWEGIMFSLVIMASCVWGAFSVSDAEALYEPQEFGGFCVECNGWTQEDVSFLLPLYSGINPIVCISASERWCHNCLTGGI